MKGRNILRGAFVSLMIVSLYLGTAFAAHPAMEIREIFSDSQSLQ